jgi:hypothetical protein
LIAYRGDNEQYEYLSTPTEPVVRILKIFRRNIIKGRLNQSSEEERTNTQTDVDNIHIHVTANIVHRNC